MSGNDSNSINKMSLNDCTIDVEYRRSRKTFDGMSKCLVLSQVLRRYAALNKQKQLSQCCVPKPFWSEILPYCVNDFLDLRSIIRLRQTCVRLHTFRGYDVKSCCLASTAGSGCVGTLTEKELLESILPQLKYFLTSQSFKHLSFSRCCLLSDTFPKALVRAEEGQFCRQLRSLSFDFCYGLTDKTLEILFLTPLPHLETLSLRGARSRDLTGAPFSAKKFLNETRWPRFQNLCCSCTQVGLCHLDSAAAFLFERGQKLCVAPKLEIAGSIGSISLLRRLSMEKAHRSFVEALVHDTSLEAVKAATVAFEIEVFA